MRGLIILAVLGFCGYMAFDHFSKPQVRLNANGEPMIRLYVFDSCGAPCNDATDFLRERKLPFEELDAEDDWDAYHQIGGRDTFPTLIAGSHTVHGWDAGKYQAAMASTLGRDGVWANEWRLLQKNFDASGAPKVVMYSTTTCGYCTKARRQFDAEGINYTEIFIDRDAAAKDDFKTLYGSGTPLIYSGYNRQSGYSRRLMDNLF